MNCQPWAQFYIFCAFPKTGAHRWQFALEARAMKRWICLLEGYAQASKRRKRLQGSRRRGRLWSNIRRLPNIERRRTAEEKCPQMFTFALVRNPWTGMVSYYHWCANKGSIIRQWGWPVAWEFGASSVPR